MIQTRSNDEKGCGNCGRKSYGNHGKIMGKPWIMYIPSGNLTY
jgi:hypothetical protein